jgi:hypothetical protein
VYIRREGLTTAASGPPAKRRILAAAALALLLSAASPAAADQGDCAVPPELTLSRPDPVGVPTEVTAGVFLIDLQAVDDASQTFSADFIFLIRWRDERLLDVGGRSLAGCRVSTDAVWGPRVIIINERNVRRAFEDFVEIQPNGELLYQQRFQGVFTNQLHLRDFPLDRQSLTLRIVLGRTRPEEITFVEDERSGRADELSIADWTVTGAALQYEPFRLPTTNELFPQIRYRLEVERNRAYYVQKVFLPLILIVFMSWAVFWIDPKLVPPQVGISTSAVLTLIAFLFSLAYTLPRLSYLTRADRFVMGATVLVFFAFGEALLSTGLASRGRERLALRIDRVSRVAFPTAFGAILLHALLL